MATFLQCFPVTFLRHQESDKRNPETDKKDFLLFLVYFFDAHHQQKINFTSCINQQTLSLISILKLVIFFMN